MKTRKQIREILAEQGIRVTDYMVKRVATEQGLPVENSYETADVNLIVSALGGTVSVSQSTTETLPQQSSEQAETSALVAISQAAEPFLMVHAAIDAAEDAQAEQLAQRVERFVPNVLTRAALKLKDRQPAKVSVLDVILTGLMPANASPALNPQTATHLMAPH